ncbi:MAG: polysulfide reductase NrfD [Nitrospinota bacterium]|nr:polysulfide reductase NrfD [Nitrospinota bacterium]
MENRPCQDCAKKTRDFSPSRRRFLGMAAISGAAMATGPAWAAGLDEFTGWPEGFGMLSDLTRCVGCRKCEQACNQVNNLPAPEKPFNDESVFDQHRQPTASAYTVVNRYIDPEFEDLLSFRKIQCNHCNEPACASACPAHAYSKTPEGAVVYDESLCFGCRYCMVACPYGVPAFRYQSALEPKIVKCTFCHQRIAKGELPGCAEACPSGALLFGKRSDLLFIARERIRKFRGDYITHIFGEFEAGGSAWLYLSKVPFEELGFPVELPKKPMIEYTKGYLASVPLVLTIWPALFGMFYAAVKYRRPEEVEPPIDPAPAPYAAQGVSFSHWFMDKLFMGMSFREYAISLATPVNLLFGVILSMGLWLLGTRFIFGLGSVTHASNLDPWGLLIGWGLFVGVPLSATGFVITTAYYIFGYKALKPYVRVAVLTGLLGYLFAVIYLLIDLGRPWRIYYPMFISFGPASVLFLVAWHVALYTMVQALEFSPTVLEWLVARRVKRWAMRITVAMTIFGIILSTLHQSALGALFLLTPAKIHPLWYSTYMPVFYLVSSVYAALAFVMLVIYLTARLLKERCGDEYLASLDSITLSLAGGAAVSLYVYVALKIIGVAHDDLWGMLGDAYGTLFMVEVGGLALLPAVALTLAVRMASPGLARWAALASLLGVALNRLNVCMVAFNWSQPGHLAAIIPPLTELGVAMMVTVVHILVFTWIVNRMPVARQSEGAPGAGS